MGHGLARFLAELRTPLMGISLDAQSVACAADELTGLSQTIDSNAQTTAQQASDASASAEQVSANVNTVAAAAEQMTASVQEIAHRAASAAKVASEAVQLTASTDTTVRQLSDSSTDIGDIIQVITGIAEQTNLLALNATIEAARAGEAGKGFAVVANEVKGLAKETAKATEEIGQKITAIQDGSSHAVDAISRITGIINQINDIQSTIASAVEQQSATTNEISRSVSEAATGSAAIAQNISQVADNAQMTLSATTVALTTASNLAHIATGLQHRVKEFELEADSSYGEQVQNAIAAHGQWKKRLHDAIISGSSLLTVDQGRDDKRCDFGGWLNQLSPAEKTSSYFQKAQKLHGAFHKEAARILELALARQQTEANAAMAADSAFATLSKELTAALIAWQQDRVRTVASYEIPEQAPALVELTG
jgi:hypothetical protein